MLDEGVPPSPPPVTPPATPPSPPSPTPVPRDEKAGTLPSRRSTSVTSDAGRTLALATFGFFHYGVTAKTLYLWYDRVLGKTPTVRNAMTKMVLDVYVHTPLLLIPTFYAITCSLRGRSVDETASQLRREWWDASFGSAVFWTPLCLLNFLYVPQHSRIAAISVGSFVHKTWLSWLSNRHKI